MTTQISPQIRIVALAGLLLALAGGAASILLARGRSVSAPETIPAATHATVAARPAPAPAKPAAPAKPVAHPAKPAARTRHATAPAHAKPRTTAHGRLVDARLPRPLQLALARNRVVVVSLYNPRADVDAISVAEAHAGANDAHVGFLLVSVLDDAVAGRLTALLPGGGLLPDPGILVYRAPGTLVYRFDGFTDRDSVAQAATNAKPGDTAADVEDPSLATGTPTTAAASGTTNPTTP